MDPGLNQLLKWSIENSEAARNDPTSSTDTKAERPDWSSGRPLNPETLKALMGGPSDADLMKQSMAAIQSPDISTENKLVAFDNFEQLIENLDNANNMESLRLWTPLVSQLESPEADMRRMAAWCLGTAVQNNVKAQERVCLIFELGFKPLLTAYQLLAVDAIPKLIHLASEDSNEAVRRKCIYALSSEIRNYQPGLAEAIKAMPTAIKPSGAVDAGDMDAVDQIINALREGSRTQAS